MAVLSYAPLPVDAYPSLVLTPASARFPSAPATPLCLLDIAAANTSSLYVPTATHTLHDLAGDRELFAEFVAEVAHLLWHRSRPASSEFAKAVGQLLTTTGVSDAVATLALQYLHRMASRQLPVRPGAGSEYRSFTTALILANKFLDDNTFTSKTWSEVTRISTAELNAMEREFLHAIHYDLYITDDAFARWEDEVLALAPYVVSTFLCSRTSPAPLSPPYSGTYVLPADAALHRYMVMPALVARKQAAAGPVHMEPAVHYGPPLYAVPQYDMFALPPAPAGFASYDALAYSYY
jgi:hypothetical protein